MTQPGLIFGIAALLFGIRASGLYQRQKELPEFWIRFFRYVPLGALTALVVPNLGGSQGEWLPRLAGAIAAIIAVRFTRLLWPGIILGMLVFWITRSFL